MSLLTGAWRAGLQPGAMCVAGLWSLWAGDLLSMCEAITCLAWVTANNVLSIPGGVQGGLFSG